MKTVVENGEPLIAMDLDKKKHAQFHRMPAGPAPRIWLERKTFGTPDESCTSDGSRLFFGSVSEFFICLVMLNKKDKIGIQRN